jgi:hypothetical protein
LRQNSSFFAIFVKRTPMTIQAARSFDGETAQEKCFAWIAVELDKCWIAKRTPHFVYECLECLGGGRLCREKRRGTLLPGGTAQRDLGRLRSAASRIAAPLRIARRWHRPFAISGSPQAIRSITARALQNSM